MLSLQSGDRIELYYADAPWRTLLATVGRLLTDREEGMGIEVEDYAASWIEITLVEGKNRQVRRMTAEVGFPTLRLIRVAIGSLRLGGLAAGKWKEIARPHP